MFPKNLNKSLNDFSSYLSNRQTARCHITPLAEIKRTPVSKPTLTAGGVSDRLSLEKSGRMYKGMLGNAVHTEAIV